MTRARAIEKDHLIQQHLPLLYKATTHIAHLPIRSRGTIGGSLSHEFQVLAESGEDALAACNSCDYAANTQKAESRHLVHRSGGTDAPLP